MFIRLGTSCFTRSHKGLGHALRNSILIVTQLFSCTENRVASKDTLRDYLNGSLLHVASQQQFDEFLD